MKSNCGSSILHPDSVRTMCTVESSQMDSRDVMSQSSFNQTSIAVSPSLSMQSSRDDEESSSMINRISERIFTPGKARKLLLILRADQIVQNECPNKSIRNRFQEV